MTALTIVIADDDASSLELIAMFLEMEGHNVLTAKDGLEACAILMTHAPDVVVLDSSMPGLGGAEVARVVRAEERLRNCRIIGLSGHETCDPADSGLFDRYLTKPATPANLRDAISHRNHIG